MHDIGPTLSDELKFFMACLIGASVRVLRDQAETWTFRGAVRKVADIASGTAVAFYLGPGFTAWFTIDSPAVGQALGFLIGYMAMELCGFGITVLSEILPGVARWWVAARAGVAVHTKKGD